MKIKRIVAKGTDGYVYVARVYVCFGAIVWINVNLAFIAVWLDYTWIGLYCNLLFMCVCVCSHPHPHLKSREINCFRLNSHDNHWKSLCEYSNKPIQFEIKLNFCPTMWFQCCWIIQVYTLDVDFRKFDCMNSAVDQMLDAMAQTNTNAHRINNSGKNSWVPIENARSFNALSNSKAWINSPFCCFIHWFSFVFLLYFDQFILRQQYIPC